MKTKLTLIGFFVFFLNCIAAAQCNPYIESVDNTTAVVCESQIINLYANSPGYNTTILWTFGNGDQSTNSNANYAYNTHGSYTITFTGTGFAGTCTETLSVVVKPVPDIDVSLVSADSQCFEDNNFCLTDLSTAPLGKIAEMRYIFSDGQQFDTLDPTFPVNLCKFFGDPSGGSYDMVVQAYDTSGCVAQEVYQNFTYVSPKIGTFFTNTSGATVGCNGTLGSFINTSTITRSKIYSFEWHYGDGTIQKGTKDSLLLWNGTSHLYTTGGSYGVTLKTYASSGCEDEFTINAAIINVSLNPKITKNKDIFSFDENPISFGVNGLGTAEPVNQFMWNFGEPSSGPNNFSSTTLTPTHTFGLGAKLVSLRIQAGPCDITTYDTIQIVGPHAQIEAVNNRISQAEKIQCGTADSIHFSNASLFYHNDNNPLDEDSVILVNGTSQFAFNYTPPSNGGSIGTGDQAALTSAAHIANRTMGSQVQRIWNFGDEYAPQCTTSLAKGLNIGLNCNYSEDEFPVHKYQSWDSIYRNYYYSTNYTFKCTKYNETISTCYIENIDTANAAKHRELFDNQIAKEYTATLWLRDTVNNRESTDNISIDIRKPDASKMTLVSGTPCPFTSSGTTGYQLEFDMNAGGKSYFAVNFDSVSYGASGFTPYNQGILAPPKPGSPVPFLLPYNITGGLGDKFVKGYTPGEIGSSTVRTPKGSFTMGLIVGKGPLSANGGPPTCVDTAWYPDIFRIPTLDASFDIVAPSADKKYICAGESAAFEIDEPFQNDIATLRWNWGHQGNGEGPDFDFYIEEFNYLQKYTGPSPTRNDKDVAYAGEDWLYNYIVRSTLTDVAGISILDTIVSAIVKDWKTEATYESPETYDALSQNLGCSEVPKEEQYKLWGDGTFGCIDTTGLSAAISTTLSEYRSYNGDTVYMVDNKRYRYTNATHTDSIEVAHVLHFRDSSLQGYDTLIDGTDTTLGVWKKEYTYQKVVDGDTLTLRAKGALSPSLSLTNTTGCEARGAELLNVGFIADFSIQENNLCEGLEVVVDDYIRYYQYGEEDPFTYPIKTLDNWNDPQRYTASPPLETFHADWNASTIEFDSTRSLPLRWTYNEQGEYEITIVAEDSTGCTDTTELYVSVSDINLDFSYTEDFSNCETIINFTDNTTVSTPKDSILSWRWDFGDGTRRSILQNPQHIFTSSGFFEVTMIAYSLNGCIDSVKKVISIPGPQPKFGFIRSLVFGEDPAQICPGQPFKLINTSTGNPISSPTFQIIWGDKNSSNGGKIGDTISHIYTEPGTYELHLIMEDNSFDASRCSRIFPDTSNSLLNKTKIIVIVNPKPSASISVGTSPTYEGHPTSFTAKLDSKYTRINWFMGNGDIINLPNSQNKQIIYKYPQTGIYQVILAPEFNQYPRCWARDTFELEVLDASLNSIVEPSIDLEIFPNPASDVIYIVSKEGETVHNIELTDILGKSCTPTTSKFGSKTTIDVSGLAAGNYILKVTISKGTTTKKIQIEKE